MTTIKDYAGIAADLEATIRAGKMPSPEKLWQLQAKLNAKLPENLKIPEVPNIPSPVLPHRNDLNLLKKKNWNGVNIGDKDIASIYSNAWFEVRASEIRANDPSAVSGAELDARGEGKGGAYVFAREINVVYGNAQFSAKPTAIKGSMVLKILGEDVWPKPPLAIDKEFSAGDQKAFRYDDKLTLEREFFVGPVPVIVKGSLSYGAYFGYEYGITFVSITGRIIPGCYLRAEMSAGVGVRAISFGVNGAINIIDLSLPVAGSASLAFDKTFVPYLHLSIDSTFQYSYLDGYVAGYIDYPWFDCRAWPPKCWWKTNRVEKELFKWSGERGSRKIMSWGMDLNPFGAKMQGDIVDQIDNQELSKLKEEADLHLRQQEMFNAEAEVNKKEKAIANAIIADMDSSSSKQIDPQYITELNNSLEEMRIAYLNKLKELSEN
ncbi:MAG: hypothetical protein HQK51_13790 [Oligoflexia bacterium]|nr:hypothetical protein [Oligoflexia bacterium]